MSHISVLLLFSINNQLFFDHRFEHKVIYVKIVYDPTVLNAEAIRVSIEKRVHLFPMQINKYIEIKW